MTYDAIALSIKGIKVGFGIGYKNGDVKVREFIDRLYLIDGKWYIYELVDDRHLKDENTLNQTQ